MRLLVVLLILLYSKVLFSQTTSNIPIGTWRTHLPTTSVTTIALNQGKLYCASTISSFTFDLTDNHLATLSRIDGLAESDISVIRFNEKTNTGIIGYASGNIDLIINGKLTNFNLILQSGVQGSKNINDIVIYDQIAFISCDFGVVLIDLVKIEVKESWLDLNVNALPNKIYNCTLNDAQDSVFLATQYGVLSAPYYTPNNPGLNLMDFSNWSFNNNTLPSTNVTAVASLNGTIYAAVTGKGVYILNGSNWQNINLTSFDTTQACHKLTYSNNSLILCATNQIYAINSSTSFIKINSNGNFANVIEAVYDHSGNLWIADKNNGLIEYNVHSAYQFYSLNGPLTNATFSLYYYNNTILANSGGYSVNYSQLYYHNGFYEFQNQDKWVNYYGYDSGYPISAADNIVSKYNPYDDTLYMGHYGSGLLAWKKSTGEFVLHDNTNSPLTSLYVTGLDIDSIGNLWVATYQGFAIANTVPALYSKDKNGKWTTYSPVNSNGGNGNNIFPLQLKIDQQGNKWMRTGNNTTNGGLFVYNEQLNLSRTFSTSSTDGLPSTNVFCMELDKTGILWVGTDKGLAGFYYTSQAFSGAFTTPIYNGYPILFQSIVNCIKTDGANRKWVGTTDGLWLFNSDFTQSLAFFNINNSPLYSNNIIALEIHALTGELFIATDQGIISYRTDATDPSASLNPTKIFPNPVRPDYNGVIAIEGLTDKAVVKITDMQGKLYYETRANGGTATWNMMNYAGVKAESGMYMVFVSDAAGSEKFVGKIAIIQ